MAISETDVDSLGLVSLSYGNQGLNPDLVEESECLSSNGTVDCTGETVQVLRTPARSTILISNSTYDVYATSAMRRATRRDAPIVT